MCRSLPNPIHAAGVTAAGGDGDRLPTKIGSLPAWFRSGPVLRRHQSMVLGKGGE